MFKFTVLVIPSCRPTVNRDIITSPAGLVSYGRGESSAGRKRKVKEWSMGTCLLWVVAKLNLAPALARSCLLPYS